MVINLEQDMKNNNPEYLKNLEVIAKYDNGFLHPGWMASAQYFQQEAENKTDISDAIPHLLSIYTSSNHITIMEYVGNAVIKHAFNFYAFFNFFC